MTLLAGLIFYFEEHESAAAEMNMSDQDMKEMAAPAKIDNLPAGYTDIHVPGEIRQRIGVITGRVEEVPLTMSIRAVGIVQPNETKVDHIHLKTEGWIEKLYVAFTGQQVKAGDPLLTIYSQSFLAAQGELLAALQSAR
ncbi:MAG TPA: efflux RND transporter periplasmic adaptor subunit, partial [Rhodopila sp.]|nr:efflux RND transporter periplasmic adaptor subunit [Rhodopila sp.]